jgi:hypothetical protein
VAGNAGHGGANGSGGARSGGGLYVASGSVSLTNDTISENSAASGGGLDLGDGTLLLLNCTVAGNSVASGGTAGGLEVAAGTATLDNTIVALNTAGSGSTASASDIAGTIAAASAYNLIGTGGSGGLVNGVHGNLVGVANPGLGTLANNGGSTQTIAVLPGSPAIGAGSDSIADVTVPTTDQRGVARPRNSIDIGAFQDRGFRLTIVTGSSPQSTTVNSAFPHALAVIVTSPYGDPVAGGVIRFTVTAAANGASATLGASEATIGANGEASVTATANGTAGAYDVTASAAGARRAVRFALRNLPASASSIVSADAAGTIGTAASQTVALGLGVLPADAAPKRARPGLPSGLVTDGPADELAASLLAASRSVGTSNSASSVPLAIGTVGQPSPWNGPTSRASSPRPAPRAEIRLAARGRGWSLGTSSKNGGLDIEAAIVRH